MDEKRLTLLMRLVIILIGLCGVMICLFWLPMSSGKGWVAFSWAELKKVEFLAQYAFQWLISLPCFWLLIMAWKMTLDMQKGRLFIEQNVLLVKKATVILLVNIILYLAGNITFSALGWNAWLVLQLFAALVGLIITILLFIFSQYLMQAAVLQEESDLTI